MTTAEDCIETKARRVSAPPAAVVALVAGRTVTVPVGQIFHDVPEWMWKALGEVARDAPEQFPRALTEALASLRASAPRFANATMGQLVKSLYLGMGTAAGAAPVVVAAMDTLGGIGATVAAAETAATVAATAAGGTIVAAAATEVVVAGAGGTAAGGTATAAAGWLSTLGPVGLTVGALIIGGLLIGGVMWYKNKDACACETPTSGTPAASDVIVAKGATPTPKAATTRAAAPTAVTCSAQTKTVKLCPDSPKGAAAQACGPGFCWDGGYNHTLACKQEVLPANAHRGYTSEVICNDGYAAAVDSCSNVVTACVKK